MKEILRGGQSAALRRCGSPLLLRGRLQRMGSWFLGAVILSGAAAGGQALPLAACLLSICSGFDRAAAALGALLGYGLHWGMAGAAESWGTLALMSLALLPGRLPQAKLPWLAGACSAAVGVIFAADAGFSLPSLGHWALCIVLAAGGTTVLRQAAAYRNRAAQTALWAAVVLSLAAIPLPMGLHLGIPALFWAASLPDRMGLLLAAAGGAVLELAAVPPTCTGLVCLSALCAQLLRRRTPLQRQLTLFCLLAAWNLLMLPLRPAFCVAAGLGLAAAVLRPLVPPQQDAAPPLPTGTSTQALQQAAQALGRIHTTLAGSTAPELALPPAELFDRTAERVCRSCPRRFGCWQREAAQTCADLNEAAPAIETRGRARKEDFPARFLERCTHSGAFLSAINAELEAHDRSRLFRSRMAEGRNILAAQYRILQTFLVQTAERADRGSGPRRNYRPDVAAQASGRRGSSISGDRGACFNGPDGTCYVLLCDGMGAGSGAAGESIAAVRLLTVLLQAGMDAADALQTLNGVYILRDNGCFSTVDLLRINLVSGDAILYKWGAAPSWLRHRRGIRRLGSVGVPPGLAADCRPEEIRLRLDRGQTLLLATDGIDTETTEQRLRAGPAASALELAAYVMGDETAEDDRTVVAVRLENS